MTNSGDGNGSYGALVDTPAFSANLVPLGATWTTSGAGAPAGGSDASAPYALTSGTTSIGAGVTHTYDMVLTFRFTDGKPATTCAGSGTGLFNAVAAASGETGTTTDNSACVNPPQPPTTRLVLDKRVASVADVNGNGLTDAGDTIQWEFDLTNQSQVTLTDVKVVDPLAGSATCATTTLAPGATTTCTADAAYVITAADVQAGSVENIATSTGEAPWGDPAVPGDDVRSNDDTTITPLDQTTRLVLDKRVASVTDVNGNGITDEGDTIQWEFELTNESNVTLTDLKVSDPLAGAVTCAATTLAPGASTLCTADASYAITAADVTTGEVLNVATAKGEGPGGDPNDPSDDVPSNPDSTRTPVEAVDTELVLDKRVSSVTDVNGNGLTDLGDEIQWEFESTNNSNVTLTDLAVVDPLAGPVTCAATTLAPGASTTCTADAVHVITQADVDAGKVVNTATSKGEAPGGDPNDPSDDVKSNPDTTTTPVQQVARLSLDKRVASVTDVNGNGLTDLGDEIQWEFEPDEHGNGHPHRPEGQRPAGRCGDLCGDHAGAGCLDHVHRGRRPRHHAGRHGGRLGGQPGDLVRRAAGRRPERPEGRRPVEPGHDHHSRGPEDRSAAGQAGRLGDRRQRQRADRPG
ncbi:hypothetical protein G5V59_15670 [Nocardioides sp. W3-2-3]|uniref:DUF7507 domain-containing protein n=1 Tax=Nocardioides convexus TaxID=2712224 RepID=UPI00241844FF|nr:hypothetical protein [Nocardioides convexus]NHA00872.1 hypothetical protein [Nocardioides convexus]